MAKMKMKEGYGKVMVDGALIKQDYTKHANLPDHVIVKDLDMRDMSYEHSYDDTMGGIDRQMSSDRKMMNRNKPKSRY